MEPLRDLLRNSLSAALDSLSPQDRISASWSVVCGPAITARTRVLRYENGLLEISVPDGAWLRQMTSLREKLLREIPSVSALPLTDILFIVRPEDFATPAAPAKQQIGSHHEQH